MITIKDIQCWGIENAIKGIRNSYDSWDKSDSFGVVIGDKDMQLCDKLIKGGSEHRKFLRQIFVSMDINAPLYWWKEFDTYKIGTTANSSSTMHTLTKRKEFYEDDFSLEAVDADVKATYIKFLNGALDSVHINAERKMQLIQLLPSSFNQLRTVTCNYEVLLNICKQRAGHFLTEWKDFIDIVVNDLPYLAHWSEVYG